MYVYIYIYMYLYMYIYIYVHVYMCVHIDKYQQIWCTDYTAHMMITRNIDYRYNKYIEYIQTLVDSLVLPH